MKTYYRGNPIPLKLSEYSIGKFEKGSDLGAKFAEGPGLYFTTDKNEAVSYGGYLNEIIPIVGKSVIRNIEDFAIRLVRHIPDDILEIASNDFGGFDSLMEYLFGMKTYGELLSEVWSSVFSHQKPQTYVTCVKHAGLSGIIVKKNASEHLVMFDSEAFEEIV